MKNILIISAAALLAAMTVSAAGPAERQINQQKRIAQGVRSGQLTRPEAVRLERNAVRLNRSIRRDRRDQGVFTPRERLRAQTRLGAQSRAIYRQKHDGQQRPSR